MKKSLGIFFIVCALIYTQSAHAFKLHNPFSKKSRQEAEKMVQTKEEWEEKAKNVKLEEREIPNYQRPQDKDFKPKTPPSTKFAKYNVNAGEREVDISKLKNKLDFRSQGVFSPNFKYMAYGEYYYSPSYDSVSSDIYVQKLKSGTTRMQKALSATILNVKRSPAISSGTDGFTNHLFSTLTIVDFSKDSKKLLVKEKIGSSTEGIFRNYVWIYYMQGDETQWFPIKYTVLNETIKNSYARKTGLALNNYRWDIRILGFSKENPDLVLCEAIAWDTDKKEIFLGLWGLNSNDASVSLISEKPIPVQISANGIIVKEYLP